MKETLPLLTLIFAKDKASLKKMGKLARCGEKRKKK
jgi:hypothetical protein